MAKLRILVGGYVVGLPLAGMTWHHLHYLLGLRRLGHRVAFVEDAGWSPPYDPVTYAYGDPTYGLAYLRRCLAAVGLEDVPWCYVHDGRHHGLRRDELDAEIKAADLYVAVSGVTPWPADRPRPRRTLGVDTDPVYTQAKLEWSAESAAYWDDFDALASFGTRLGGRWFPTRQPIVLDRWPVIDPPSDAAFTTIGQWGHSDDRHVDWQGRRLLSSKAAGWRMIRDLPRRTGTAMTMAMSHVPDKDRAAFESAGWRVTEPAAHSLDLAAYGRFVAGSLGEVTPAKEIYSGSACGWFSDRSACYLAAGRPVVAQDTGFDHGPLALPAGEGLFAWRDAEDAAAAVREVVGDWRRHSRAARSLASGHFAHDRVLPDLLEHVMSPG